VLLLEYSISLSLIFIFLMFFTFVFSLHVWRRAPGIECRGCSQSYCGFDQQDQDSGIVSAKD
jgi:hypothetical protein